MFSLLTAMVLASTTLGAGDRAILEQLKATNDAAWTAKDVATIRSQYVRDATIRTSPDGQLVAGDRAIETFFAGNFARRQGELRHVTTLAHLEPLDEDSVLSEGDVRVEKRESNGSWSLVRRFRTISVAVRDGSGWKLRSVRAIPLN